ncbi:hypothetical protein ACQJBY_018585 [Aegilops geniculata]
MCMTSGARRCRPLRSQRAGDDDRRSRWGSGAAWLHAGRLIRRSMIIPSFRPSLSQTDFLPCTGSFYNPAAQNLARVLGLAENLRVCPPRTHHCPPAPSARSSILSLSSIASNQFCPLRALIYIPSRPPDLWPAVVSLLPQNKPLQPRPDRMDTAMQPADGGLADLLTDNAGTGTEGIICGMPDFKMGGKRGDESAPTDAGDEDGEDDDRDEDGDFAEGEEEISEGEEYDNPKASDAKKKQIGEGEENGEDDDEEQEEQEGGGGDDDDDDDDDDDNEDDDDDDDDVAAEDDEDGVEEEDDDQDNDDDEEDDDEDSLQPPKKRKK